MEKRGESVTEALAFSESPVEDSSVEDSERKGRSVAAGNLPG